MMILISTHNSNTIFEYFIWIYNFLVLWYCFNWSFLIVCTLVPICSCWTLNKALRFKSKFNRLALQFEWNSKETNSKGIWFLNSGVLIYRILGENVFFNLGWFSYGNNLMLWLRALLRQTVKQGNSGHFCSKIQPLYISVWKASKLRHNFQQSTAAACFTFIK